MPISEGIKLGRYEIRAHIGTNDGLLSARDIKPENIMLRRRDGIVKVLDFGLAKPVKQGAMPVERTRPCIHKQES